MTVDVETSPENRIRLSPWLRWGLLALIQLGLIAIPLADRLSVQSSGNVVRLAVVPVDPRDLLRGDYVIINLAITRLPAGLQGADGFNAGDRIFVELAPQVDGAAEPVAVARDRSKLGTLAIAGTVRSATAEEIRVDYGIDAFFLPEGEGLEIERMDRDRLLLEVSVTEDGRSLPVNLLVDGKTFRSDAIF
ncbi:GDYXXLXY domain-containing protein [Roseibium sediminicola]|uniref:GDYXXLXY domain-containing protein n=1 Tax=Roseibium sediminicola TaxID=2933272 RepID=A0ABT0H175_9HYPH|nr:GDYXXLXY domain-containing protein [Roseibium sp. CAU 1639]MCK7615444.1 GDYXXLXY domain-containing protein [Roseibium sp. CAU 1639]